jgi:hypothetical protein
MHARLQANVLRLKPRHPRPYGVVGPLPPLAAPINAGDTTRIARAQSLLYGWVRDSSGLTADEAREVVDWHERHIAASIPQRRSWLSVFNMGK